MARVFTVWKMSEQSSNCLGNPEILYRKNPRAQKVHMCPIRRSGVARRRAAIAFVRTLQQLPSLTAPYSRQKTYTSG